MDELQWSRVLAAMRRGPTQIKRHGQRPIVLFHTPWERLDDGWSIAARAYARAMDLGGIDVRLVSWKDVVHARDFEVANEVGRFNQPTSSWDLHVFSCALGGAGEMAPIFNNMVELNSGPQAFHCVFERRYIEPDLAAALNKLNGVWAQCTANYNVLTSCGVENVTLIPFPFFDDDPYLKVPLPEREPRVFLHVGRYEPRKAQDNLIRAFMRAFSLGEAKLILKVSSAGNNTTMYEHYPEEVILDEIKSKTCTPSWNFRNWRESIELIRERLSAQQMVELYARSDVYVSSSRGEGLDLPAFAAKLAGRRLVLTASGGPEDFAADEDLLVQARGLIPAHPFYSSWWGDGACYIDYDLNDLIAALQSARKTPCTVRGWPGMAAHRAQAIGEKLREWATSLK